jgi:AbrB family looped-hinge helix DNA binding protein
MSSTIDAQGRVILPKSLREELRLKPGDRVKFFVDPYNHLVLLPVIPVSALRGILKTRRHATIAQMDEAIATGITERYRNSTK